MKTGNVYTAPSFVVNKNEKIGANAIVKLLASVPDVVKQDSRTFIINVTITCSVIHPTGNSSHYVLLYTCHNGTS